MNTLLVWKHRLALIFSRYEVYFSVALKFLAMLVALICINKNIGFMSKLKNPAIVLILSLLCSFLPANVIVLVCGLVIVAHVYALSLECAVVVLIIFMIMYAFYFRFTPKDVIAAILTPICCSLHLPYVMPLAMGFVGTPLSSISVGCGTVTYYIVRYISDHQEALASGGKIEVESALSGFKGIIDGLLKNDEMVLMVAAAAVTIIIVYVIRKLPVNYSWKIALGVGAVVDLLVVLIGGAILDVSVGAVGAFFGMIASVLIVLVLQFFIFNVDYARAESVQFEDDDYYYYVKAIPKVYLEAPNSGARVRKMNAVNSRKAADDEYDYYDEVEE